MSFSKSGSTKCIQYECNWINRIWKDHSGIMTERECCSSSTPSIYLSIYTGTRSRRWPLWPVCARDGLVQLVERINYRPVSLTCITSKLMKHVVCSHIRAHLDKMSILSPFQHGFLPASAARPNSSLLSTIWQPYTTKACKRTLVSWTFPKLLMSSPIKDCLTSSPTTALTAAVINGSSPSWGAEPRRWWWMEHFQMRHPLLVEFLRGTSSGPCCFFFSSMICLPQPHPELGYNALRMTASSTAPSATHRTKSRINMTLTTWSAGPSNGGCDSALQSAKSWGQQGPSSAIASTTWMDRFSKRYRKQHT